MKTIFIENPWIPYFEVKTKTVLIILYKDYFIYIDDYIPLSIFPINIQNF